MLHFSGPLSMLLVNNRPKFRYSRSPGTCKIPLAPHTGVPGDHLHAECRRETSSLRSTATEEKGLKSGRSDLWRMRPMAKSMTFIFTAAVCLAGLLAGPGTALALQVHAFPEGLYAHQIAHAFFIVSMGIFAFWLHKMRLIEKRGWRYIQISCFLFILWNLDAVVGHAIDSRLTADAFSGGGFTQSLVTERAIAPYFYYFLKMDHLICVPAMVLLLMGLKRLNRESDGGER